MIIPRECLVRPGIIDSELVCALSLAAQLFFRNLLHCCDGAGRFPADAAEIRHALYYRTPNVASSHVEAWMQKCADARLVKLYTRDGKRYGEILKYGQRDTKRRTLYPPAEGQDELILAADPPPKRARPPRTKTGSEEKRREEKGRESATAPAFFAPSETQELWIERLVREYPQADIRAQIAQAHTNRRLHGKQLERVWFETQWLTKLSPAVQLDSAAPAAAPVPPEPANWRQMLKTNYRGESWALSALACTWTTLPGSYRARILAGA